MAGLGNTGESFNGVNNRCNDITRSRTSSACFVFIQKLSQFETEII